MVCKGPPSYKMSKTGNSFCDIFLTELKPALAGILYQLPGEKKW
jgi:hypothetical protein